MRKNRYSWTSRRQWSSGGRPDRADPPFPVVRLPGSADGTYRVDLSKERLSRPESRGRKRNR
jgi:hypothetical protein